MQTHTLSKSTYIRGLQCEKSLYLYKHFYELKDAVSKSQQTIFDQGNKVGLLAQDLFPEGMDASSENHFEYLLSVETTKQLIKRGETVIYEATFLFNNVVAAIDILVKDASGWKAYEVKSSTGVSETYIKDASIQYYIISNSGIDLQDISIVHINNQYVRNGAIDVHQLFTIESVLDKVKLLQSGIPVQLEAFQSLLNEDDAPTKDIGRHCDHPYPCDYKGSCWKHIPEYSVFNISGLNNTKKFDLYNQGIVTFDHVDPNCGLFNSSQQLQICCEQENRIHIEKEKIAGFLNNLNYPIHYLDFETINPAIPIYDNTKPYEQTVFQYSLHIQNKSGELTHLEYLAETDPKVDPRVEFVVQLIQDCGSEGDILVYNIGFERSKLQQLAELYPWHKTALEAIILRMKDLMIPFQQKWYYDPKMKGSYSIKYVLPALVPELSYQNLEIQEGGTASNVFVQMVTGEFTGNVEETKKDLLEYCKMDTLAMVSIVKKLFQM